MRFERDGIGVTGPSGLRCWTMALSVGLIELTGKYEVDPVSRLLTLARANEIDLSVADEPGRFSTTFKNRIVYDL